MRKNKKNKMFKDKAKQVYGNHYDYSLVKYQYSYQKVKIICPRHGVFEQTPSNHLQGKGCAYCSRNRLTREEFIEEMKNLYNDSNDYSKCNYTHRTKMNEKILITCKKHGDYTRILSSHLKGSGCSKCRDEQYPKKKRRIINTYSNNRRRNPNKKTFTLSMNYLNGEASINISGTNFKSEDEAKKHLDELKMVVEMTNGTVNDHSIKRIRTSKKTKVIPSSRKLLKIVSSILPFL